uniref:Uncharacterized protein n=1 Tax=Angomonas deanei TaxID=59799 RepID=C6K3N4_9TRYP|nr:conserved hypothetical protein [Angomonas deanei]
MRRHRPLQNFHESREEVTASSSNNYAQHETSAAAHSQHRRPSTPNDPFSRRHQPDSLDTGSTARKKSSAMSPSHMDCSPIPFYSEHPSTFVAPSVSTSASSAAPAGPVAFYDAPSMRDSIPALLQQLTTAPLPSVNASRTRQRQQQHQQQQRSSAHTTVPKNAAVNGARAVSYQDADKDTLSRVAPRASYPVVIPEQHHTQRQSQPAPAIAATTVKDTPRSAASLSIDALMKSIRSEQRAVNAAMQSTGGYSAHELSAKSGSHRYQHPNPTVNSRMSKKAPPPAPAPASSSSEERSGMRYVVVQKPAAVYGAAYVPPSSTALTTSGSPTDTASLPSPPARAGSRLASVSTSRTVSVDLPVNASAHLTNEVEQRRDDDEVKTSKSGRATAHLVQQTSRGYSDLQVPEKQHPLPTSRDERAVEEAATKNAPIRPSVASMHPLYDAVTRLPMQSSGSRASRSNSIDESVHSRTLHSESETTNDDDEGKGDDALSSTHVSSARMRNLFASVLERSSAHDSRLSAAGSTRPSTVHSDGRRGEQRESDQIFLQQTLHDTRHPSHQSRPVSRTIASPLAERPTLVRGVVEGGVESRRTSPAASSPSAAKHELHQGPSMPFSEAVMEGGDPLVLRHTIDYLLHKARRLEKENAVLWKQTHSWNPHRAITPENVAAVVMNVRPAAAAAPRTSIPDSPSKAKQSTSTETLAVSSQRRTAAAATQTSHHSAEPRGESRTTSRIIVQQHRSSRAAGRSASPSSSSSSSSLSAARTPPQQSGTARSNSAAAQAEESLCRTPRHAGHSVSVSSPSAEVNASAELTRRSDASVSAITASAATPQQQHLRVDDSVVVDASHHSRVVRRVEAGVQHHAPARLHDISTSTIQESSHQLSQEPSAILGMSSTLHDSSVGVPPQPLLLRSAPPTTTAAAAAAAASLHGRRVGPLSTSALRTPLPRTGTSAESRDDAFSFTPVASTVKSHHSIESRRSTGSMTTHASPPQHHRQQQPGGSSHRTDVEGRSAAGGAASTPTAAAMMTSNTSFTSTGRPATYNKQVQTASILSPAEDDSDGDTLLDSALDGAATTLSTERTAVIELHTAAAYNRSTVRRLRAYCTTLETTRQQLRRRVVLMSPQSQAGGVSASAGSRVFGASSRSSSTRSGFPLPLAHGALGHSMTSFNAAPSPSASVLSRPFFKSEYADPEVDATLHDVDETPAVETMIVLQEDGIGSVTKRVVEGSPSRLSASLARSPSPTHHPSSQPPLVPHPHQLPSSNSVVMNMASSLASYNGLEMEKSYTSVRSSPSTRRQQQQQPQQSLFLASANDGARELVPSVQLGRSLRSTSATSWPAFDSQDNRSPDAVPLRPSPPDPLLSSSASAPRFAVPPRPPTQRESGSQRGSMPSQHSPPLPTAPQEHRAMDKAAPMPVSAATSVDTRFVPTPDPHMATTRASSTTHSQRFAVPSADASSDEGGAHDKRANSAESNNSGASSVASVSSKSKKVKETSDSSEARDTFTMADAPPQPNAVAAAAAAATWDPKAAAGTTENATVETRALRPAEASRPPHHSPLQPPLSSSTATNASTTSSQAAGEKSSNSPHELATTSAAFAQDAAPLSSKRSSRVSESTTSALSRSRHDTEGIDDDPGSPLPALPREKDRNKNTSAPCKRSITVEFLDEAAPRSPPHEVVRARNFSPSASPPRPSAVENVVEKSNDADSFHASEEEEEEDVVSADELLFPEPMAIDKDSVASERAASQPTRPSLDLHLPRLISPSPPRAVSHDAARSDEDNDVVDDDKSRPDSSHTKNEVESGLEISVNSSRSRRLTMQHPPTDLPPMPPSRIIVLGQDTSSSSSLSRSLHSFSSSSSDSGTDGEGDDDDSVLYSEWF